MNRLIFHTATLQPWGDDVKPGVTKGRKCFTTWNYFRKDSELSPSGLITAPTLMWKVK